MTHKFKFALLLVLATTFAGAQARGKSSGRGPLSAKTRAEAEPLSLSELQHDIRIQHARELLGSHYHKSNVRLGENVKKINSRIYAWTRARLPKKFHKRAEKIAQTIIDESVKYEFDPVFVLSVIQNESSFNPTRLGLLDEIGLMQLRPGTAQWICQKYGMTYNGDESLHDPIENIRIGAAYMDYLRERFDSHAQLYLAAYNMGKRNVDKALEKNLWPKDYASHVMRFYVEFYTEIKQNARKKSTKTKLALL